MCRVRYSMTAFLLLVSSGATLRAQESNPSAPYEESLQQAGLGIDTPSLMQFLKLRSRTAVTPEELKIWMDQLGSDKFAQRLQASRALIALGPLSVPALRAAVSDPDSTNRAIMARRCLNAIHNSGAASETLPVTVARLIAIRKPEGGIEAVLDYLPFAADGEDGNRDALKQVLMDLAASSDGKANAAILKSLESPLPLLRSVAIDILRTQGVVFHVDRLRKLLEDPKPTVRLQASLALAQHKEAGAVTALIDLITQLPEDHARLAEEFLTGLAEERAPQITLDTNAGNAAKVQKDWKDWWAKWEGEALLDEVRKRTITGEIREKTLAALQKLNSDTFDAREAATEELKKLGVAAAPLLRKYSDHKDPEIRYRVRECLKVIDNDSGGPLSPVVARLIAYRKPENAGQVLLNYLPLAEDETVAQAVQEALNSIAYKDSKPSPVLLSALNDTNATIRGAAAAALCQPGNPEQIKKIRAMLEDKDWTVRMRVALAMAQMQDRSVMPVLIDSIGKLSETEAIPAQEYLLSLAGANTPEGVYAETTTARQQAWEKWWKAKGSNIQLLAASGLETQLRRFRKVLVVSYNYNKLAEYDRKGKLLWEMTGLQNPRDAVVLRKNRVLMVEYNSREITERDFGGKVLWRQKLPNNLYPVSIQRLSNGNNLVAGYNQVIELTRGGKQVMSWSRPSNDVRRAHRLRNGQTIVTTTSGQVHRLNRSGKSIKTWQIRRDSSNFGVQILPNGHVLQPLKYQNQIIEYDTEGKTVMTISTTQPESVIRLPNGNILVGRGNSPFGITQLDRTGKRTVSSFNLNIQPNTIHIR